MTGMPIQVDVFDDFHLHGASAPEWNQRYLQLSAGAMRSSLTEASAGDVHVFRKWMSERVVQQGCLPPGSICFALLNGSAQGTPRVQGVELRDDRLFILRGGEEFTIQRPRGMELLAFTFRTETFLQLLDERPLPAPARALLSRPILDAPPDATQQLRAHLLDALRRSQAFGGDAATPDALFESLHGVLTDAGGAHDTVGSASAGFIVAQCHRIVVNSSGAAPSVEALCRRLRTSRRSLQDSFRQVADTTPVHYLRGLRLNLVRSRLMSTTAAQLSVSQAATDQGFEHLSHFAERYKALFGELPSETSRMEAGGRSNPTGSRIDPTQKKTVG
ncbi:helix-turn-helix domain-containing protein [Variovorax sp. KK3]|uniref:helix-turn-helix domain-containing protein n=1 Tax=Variovorax sp. KK3 TaxID=1855728 RepID=UPI0015C34C13|nr:helix-turn-helix domain-containing protein [Variovorax sp. KK3]